MQLSSSQSTFYPLCSLEFDLPLAQVLPYAFGYLVDARVFSADIDTDTTIAELEALMGEIDGALVPLALVDALADHGHAQLALLLVRQRPKGGELAEARLALKASLQCGHLAEGVLQVYLLPCPNVWQAFRS